MALPFRKAIPAVLTIIWLGSLARASVITIHKWGLGEEIGGSPGGFYSTGFTENINGNPNYVNLWGSGRFGNTAAPGSSVSVVNAILQMAEGGSPHFTDLTSNFGIEFWVKVPTIDSITATVVHNGNWAIERQAGFWQLRFYDSSGGSTGRWLINSIVQNQWTDFAYVRKDGINTVYVNGVAYQSGNVLIDERLGNTAPVATRASFSAKVGYERTFLTSTVQPFTGGLDELRSFDATNFNASDLYFNQTQVPEPGSIMLSLAGLFVLARLRRRG